MADVARPEDGIEKELLDIVAEEGMIDRDTLDMDAELESLQIESADMVMILMAIEEKFGVYISVDEELIEARTVRDLIGLAVKKIMDSEEKASA